jgi:lipid A ethanolaminephosphotransferase
MMTPSQHTRQPALTRPTLSHLTLNLIVALYILTVLNRGFWSRLIDILHANPLQIGVFGLSVYALTVLLLELLGPGRLQKPVAALLILTAAGASYFDLAFGALIDREMVRNIFETTVTESRQLVTPAAILQIALTGLLPAALVFWPRVTRLRRWTLLWRWPAGVALSLAVLTGGFFANYNSFSAALREHNELMGSYQPGATLAAVYHFAQEEWQSADPTARAIATDAAKGRHLAQAAKPVLLVIYAGETARAQNFGLDGYSRDTTPGLAARHVVNFPDVSSCGTATAVSLPCMFSALPQADYSREGFLSQENLLDVLVRAGFKVDWLDNNTGDQRIALRTGWRKVDATLAPEACQGECTDEVFLPEIARVLATITQDTVLVLHMIGNHGPAYSLRYPAERATFKPACQTPQLSDCTVEEIVRAYDNALLETDFVLSRSIDMLAASDRVLPALLYVSDHGESLGEAGLYLHSAPRFMAPKEQTWVPMVMWLGQDFQSTMALDDACLRSVAQRPASHDNLFHSVLGLLDISTQQRDPALDLTETCHVGKAS